MKALQKILGLLALGCMTTNAIAQASDWQSFQSSPTRVYLDVGTQGLGLGVAKPLNSDLDLRLGLTGLGFKESVQGESLNADADLKLQNLGFYGDYFPFAASGFRLTGGIQAGTNKVTITGKPSEDGTITINDREYAYSTNDSVSGQLNMGSVAPYLGIGYSTHGAGKTGLSLTFDLGVRLGKADVSLTRKGFNSLSADTQAQLDQDLKTEQAKLSDDLKVLKTYPVIALGLSYRW